MFGRRRPAIIAALAAAWTVGTHAADPAPDASFDVGSFEKKPFEIGGYVETEWRHFEFNRDGALFGLNRYPDLSTGGNDQLQGTLHLDGALRSGIATLRASGELTGTWDDIGDDSHDATLFEGLLALQPSPGLTAEIGKKALKWGKGYAWNPVGFVERSKDPDDPTEAREGFAMLTGDFITSFQGPVRTVAFTPVVVPVEGAINDDFGAKEGFNYAAKLYLLAWDTDVDFMVLTGASKTDRFGADFSRNVTSNFEIHGEWAYITDSQRTIVDPNGGPNRKITEDARNWLIGLRYLTEKDLTVIAEYYHQGSGFTEAESSAFYDLAHEAVDTGSASLLSRAIATRDAGYGRPTPGQDYLYLRVSQKDPFDLLYWTPAATTIINANDGSFSFTPEIQYTGIEDLELRFRLGYLHGGRGEEFGEKQNDLKAEVLARFHF
ncbi:MAG: hypothetical protein IH626_15545 [Rhodospirillales bacterium]|nr:hypothetical protein [Rhodospirillales bacterium]